MNTLQKRRERKRKNRGGERESYKPLSHLKNIGKSKSINIEK
jgi:hypothetical protein